MKIIVITAVWCPSCLVMKPLFEKIKRQYTDIEMHMYDIDLDEEASKYNVGHILPVFIIENKDNIEVGRLIGEHKLEELIKMVESGY
ncbi:MAG: thioredoxin family protein [Bacilli bacterium]|jgi:thiol-disulfide isomerase/thioredoxin